MSSGVTLVDAQRFSGTCYRAANWIEVGETTGRGRMDRAHRRHGFGPVKVRRKGYGGEGLSSLHPLDAELNLPAERYSHELRRRAAEEAAKGSFDEAIASLERQLPLRSCPASVAMLAFNLFQAFYALNLKPEVRQSASCLHVPDAWPASFTTIRLQLALLPPDVAQPQPSPADALHKTPSQECLVLSTASGFVPYYRPSPTLVSTKAGIERERPGGGRCRPVAGLVPGGYCGIAGVALKCLTVASAASYPIPPAKVHHHRRTEATVLTVLMNDFTRLWADASPDVVAAISEVGESGWYILGNEVATFEVAIARRLGRFSVVGCASGLDAIEIGLRALKIRRGDKVLTTPLSAFATTLGIVRAGGVPAFVDVDESGLIDLSLVETELAANPYIRLLVPVHLYGQALDLQRLAAIKDRFGLRILEDCAQAIDARHSGLAVGSVGEISALSFYPTKNLGTLGDGGAIVTDDDSLRDTCRALRDYGQTDKYMHTMLGLNSRLDELHAAVLLHAFLPRLSRWSERRRAIAGAYLEGIDSHHVHVLPVPSGSESAWHLFPVLVSQGRREAFIAHLREHGVQAAVHYPKLICDQRAMEDVPFEVRSDLTRARAITEGEVSLPIHPYLDDTEVARVVDAVNSWS